LNFASASLTSKLRSMLRW